MHYDFQELTAHVITEKTYALYKHCMYLPSFEKFRKKMDGFLRDDRVKIFACTRNGALCGVMVLSFLTPGNAEILGIAVDPAVRSEGLGSYMIATAAVRYNLRTLVAETDDDAVGFYRKFGFAVTAFTETYDGAAVCRYHCEYTK